MERSWTLDVTGLDSNPVPTTSLCMTLDTIFNFSVPQFPVVNNSTRIFFILVRINKIYQVVITVPAHS